MNSLCSFLSFLSLSKRRNPRLFHILFIRHAESSNNVLAEEITRELGINPYGPNAGTQVLDEYDRRRLCDPHLSPLGEKQAKLLPIHPHLKDINITALAAEARVRVVTSPMKVRQRKTDAGEKDTAVCMWVIDF